MRDCVAADSVADAWFAGYEGVNLVERPGIDDIFFFFFWEG